MRSSQIVERERCSRSRRRPLIIAHRGGAPDDVENSLAAFVHGLQVGADLIECDLHTTADGTVVLFHDPHIGGIPIGALALGAVRSRVPTLLTLDEFTLWARGLDPIPRIVFDLKERKIESRLVPVLADDGIRRKCIVTTQHTRSIRRLRASYPDLRVGLSRGHSAAGAKPTRLRPWIRWMLRPVLFLMLLVQLRWSGATAVALFHGLASPATIRRLHRAGVRVYVWTVDDCADMHRLAADGVDMLATNVPRRALECLSNHQGHGKSTLSGYRHRK